MLIKRNVYFSAVDENGEEKLFSVTEIMTEEEYLEKMYSEKKLSLSDKVNLALVKTTPKKVCETMSDYCSDDEEKSKKAGKKMAKRVAIGGGAMLGSMGAAMGHVAGGGKGAAIGAAAGAAVGAGSGYGGFKLGEVASRKLRKKSEKYRNELKKTSDQYAVGAKKMTKEEYKEKYGKEKK